MSIGGKITTTHVVLTGAKPIVSPASGSLPVQAPATLAAEDVRDEKAGAALRTP